MLTKIIMPSGGQTTNESLLLKWHKKVGDEVKRGDVLFEIETDKATMEIESCGEGNLLAVYHGEGEYVTVGETVAYVGEKGEKLPDSGGNTAKAGAQNDEYQPIMKKEAAPAKEAFALSSGKTTASPAARQLARSENVNPGDVAKSTSRQPVKRSDVEDYIRKQTGQKVQQQEQKQEQEQEQEYYLVDTSTMRKVIARRMTESVSTAPHFTVSMEIDMTETIALRQLLNEHLKNSGIKVSFNDIIIKCASKAIEKHPMINSNYGDEKIKVYKNVNFGLAVGLENGLAVPVVRKTDKKSISEIASENAANIEKAETGKLQPADMTGGTITLSNLGMYGVDCFTAIINQPESCILAVGGIAEKAAVFNGQFAAKPMMIITASFDHRVIDGAVGAAFLKEMKRLLEKPQLLLV